MKLLYLLLVVAVAAVAQAATYDRNCARHPLCPLDLDYPVYIAHEEDAQKFYECTAGVACLMDCKVYDGNYVFNPKRQYCEPAETIISPAAASSQCPQTAGQTRVPHESNCQAYYNCVNGEQSKVQFCGEGLYFNPVIQMCDLFVNVNCPQASPVSPYSPLH